MRIEEHPFHILGITPRSSKREILERADALSSQADPEKINACRYQVTHPAKRLDAEVSWFPGVSPSRIRRIIDIVGQNSKLLVEFEEGASGVDCLWTFNALAYWLAAHQDVSPAAWEGALNRLAQNFQDVDADGLIAILNADRSVAGMPQIADVTGVEAAITQLGERTTRDLAEHLMVCPRHAQVMNLVVERDTDDGESPASEFIGRFGERYQILVQPALDRRGERVAASCEKVLSIAQKQPPARAPMTAAIIELEELLSGWGAIARPIQLLMKSRGRKDPHSIEIGKRVRSIAVELANEFDLYEEAQQITRNLYDVFEEVPELAELLEQDFETLDGIINAKDVGSSREEEVQTEFTFQDEEYCPECGRPMISQKGQSLGSGVNRSIATRTTPRREPAGVV